ncbi:YfhO family protein [Staphylococcus aureus]
MDFYITISILTIVALLSFKLYRFYFYRLFAIVTWILFIGSLSQYFDSAFNGFSFPERRWVYLSTIIKRSLRIVYSTFINIKYEILFNQNNTSKYHRITLCITITDTPTCTYSRYYPANGACRYFKI